MSIYTATRVTCPRCAHGFTIELLEDIHITRLPAVREEILDGRFQQFECPSCSHEVRVETDTIYTDFDAKHYVAVQADMRTDWQQAKAEHSRVFRENFDQGPEIAAELGRGFIHRLVPDIPALREKLLAWDAGLDDRVVEAVKGSRQSELGITIGDELWRLSAVLDGGHLMFARLGHNGSGGFALTDHDTVPHDSYARWATGDDLEWEFSLLLDDWVVDHFIQYTSALNSPKPDIAPGPTGREWRLDGPTDPPVDD